MNLSHLQKLQPWSVAYSVEFNNAVGAGKGMPHLPASHTILHGMKTMGKLAAVVERLDHDGGEPTPTERQTMKDQAADLVTTALRLANLYGFDLEANLLRRAAEKNGAAYPPELPAGWTVGEMETDSRHDDKANQWVDVYRVSAKSVRGELHVNADSPVEAMEALGVAVYNFLTGDKPK